MPRKPVLWTHHFEFYHYGQQIMNIGRFQHPRGSAFKWTLRRVPNSNLY